MKTSAAIKKFSMAATGAAAFLSLSAFSAQAVSLVSVPESYFSTGTGAGLITFDEPGFPVGTVNPTYAPNTYQYNGAPGTAPTVTFDGFYQGQRLSSTPVADCNTSASEACVIGTPTPPLTLDTASPDTVIFLRITNNRGLSGSPFVEGPVTVLFDRDMAGAGLEAGEFDISGTIGIRAFARDGSFIGQLLNTKTGFEFLGLATTDGSAAIAGIQFSNLNGDLGGFFIDNVRFKLPQPASAQVPESDSVIGLLAVGVLGAGSILKRKLK
jgi:hypothetical protein